MFKRLLPLSSLRRSLRAAFAILAIVVTPLLAKGIPLHDYHQNIQRALDALEKLNVTEESDAVQVEETTSFIRSTLPETHSVGSGPDVLTVDNSWLHRELRELEKATAADRKTKLERLLDRLRALEERVGEIDQTGTGVADSTNDKERLAGILSRSEYSNTNRGRNALTRLLQDFIRWVQQFLPKFGGLNPGSANILILIVQVLVIVVATALITYALVLLIRRLRPGRRRHTKVVTEARIVLGETLEPDKSATDLLSEAEALARNGDLRAAIRKAYIALLVELGDRKVLTLAQHKTNRDYLLAVKNLPLLHSTMSGLTLSFERHWYGFVDVTQTDWLAFRNGYQSALQIRS
jgi:hypothetical protein